MTQPSKWEAQAEELWSRAYHAVDSDGYVDEYDIKIIIASIATALELAAREAREMALEEAAKMCDGMVDILESNYFAEEIRKLKS